MYKNRNMDIYACPSTESYKIGTIGTNDRFGHMSEVTINGVKWTNIVYVPAGSDTYVSGYTRF